MTASREYRTLALVFGGFFAILFTLAFAFHVGSWSVGTTRHKEHRVIPGLIDTLRIDTGEGDVRVLPGTGPDVTLDSRAEGSFRVPKLGIVVVGSHVAVNGGCDQVHFGRCKASLTVHLPAGANLQVMAGASDLSATGLTGSVDLESASGDVHADGLSGPVQLSTHSGDVFANRLSGPRAQLSTDSGDVVAGSLTAPRVSASTHSGDVSLDFLESPTRVDARVDSGDVGIKVPGGESYAVDAETSSGDRTVSVPPDPRSDRTIRVRAASGDITVEPR